MMAHIGCVFGLANYNAFSYAVITKYLTSEFCIRPLKHCIEAAAKMAPNSEDSMTEL